MIQTDLCIRIEINILTATYESFIKNVSVGICTLGVTNLNKEQRRVSKIDKQAIIRFAQILQKTWSSTFELLYSVGINVDSSNFENQG
jgi:hypothetical protein